MPLHRRLKMCGNHKNTNPACKARLLIFVEYLMSALFFQESCGTIYTFKEPQPVNRYLKYLS